MTAGSTASINPNATGATPSPQNVIVIVEVFITIIQQSIQDFMAQIIAVSSSVVNNQVSQRMVDTFL